MRCFALSVSAALAVSGDHFQLSNWLKGESSGDNVDSLLNNAGSSNSAEQAIEAAVLNAGSDAPAAEAEPAEAAPEEKPADPMADEKDEDADASLASTGSQHESSEQDADFAARKKGPNGIISINLDAQFLQANRA